MQQAEQGGESPDQSNSSVSKPAEAAPSPSGQGTSSKRGPGAKEIVPLAWKLVGFSDGMPVTLLKCVERSEAEAQLERLQAERYYSGLAIYEIDAKVPVPAAAEKARQRAIDEAMSIVAERSERAKAAKGDSASRAKGKAKKVAANAPSGKTESARKGAAKSKKSTSPAKPRTASKKKPAKKASKKTTGKKTARKTRATSKTTRKTLSRSKTKKTTGRAKSSAKSKKSSTKRRARKR